MKNKFTAEELELIEVLKKYGNRKNLQKKRRGLYQKLFKEYSYILDEALPSTYIPYTLESCKAEALKYNTRGEWQKGRKYSYNAASRNKWLEECCKHMKPTRQEQNKLDIIELKKMHDMGELPPPATIRLGVVLQSFKNLNKKQYKKLFPRWNVDPRILRSYDKFIKSMPENVSMVKGQKWKGTENKYKFIDNEYGEFTGTPSMMCYCFKKGLTGHPKRGMDIVRKANGKPVKRSDGKVFNNAKEASIELGLSPCAVSNAISRGTKCKGYTFKYVK